jgi:hypothetical protein
VNGHPETRDVKPLIPTPEHSVGEDPLSIGQSIVEIRARVGRSPGGFIAIQRMRMKEAGIPYSLQCRKEIAERPLKFRPYLNDSEIAVLHVVPLQSGFE